MSSEPPSPKPRGFLDRLAAAFHDEPISDRNDLQEILHEARRINLIGADTYSMIEGALKVSELRASDLMVPRSQIHAVDLSETPDVWIRTVIESGHSRFPAVEGDLDNVLGMVHAKDLLHLILDPKTDVRTFIRPARFIPESQPTNVLLRDFKSTRSHMALVIDEFGSVSGLITIEDVLEQIVGDISDEFDHEDKAANIVDAGGGHWRVKALTPIDQFNEFFSAALEDHYCETIGGLVTDRFEHVPHAGEVIEEGGFRFKIVRADDRQAQLLDVERLKVQSKAAETLN